MFTVKKNLSLPVFDRTPNDEQNKENKKRNEKKVDKKTIENKVSDHTNQVRKELFRTAASENRFIPELSVVSKSTTTSDICESDRNTSDAPEPLPLPNIGNSCYMNSVLQTLFNCSMLMSEIEAASTSIPSKPPESATSHPSEKDSYVLTRSLITLYNQYRLKLNCIDMQRFLFDFKYDVGHYASTFRSNIQQDAVEFLDCIISSVNAEFESDPKGPIAQMLNVAFITSAVCIRCEAVTRSETEQHSMLLNIPAPELLQSDWSIQKLMDNYFISEYRKAKCDSCSCEEKLVSTRIHQLPKILLLHVLRHSSDNQKREDSVKISETIEFRKTHFSEHTM